MRGVDADVLACYVTEDDAARFAAVDAVIERARADGEKFFVSGLALCRLSEVLAGKYGQQRTAVADLLDRLLHLELFEIENRQMVLKALERYRVGEGKFADYLMAEIGKRAGCRDTLTLADSICREPGFTRPSIVQK